MKEEGFGIMLKKIAVMVFALSMMVVSSCLAYTFGPVPASEASLGGITLGSPISYVRSVYGEPTETAWGKDRLNQDAKSYRYGKGFFILERLYDNTVEELMTSANNGIATPMGITVGVPKSTVDTLYSGGRSGNGYTSYMTQNGALIKITYGRDANGVLVVTSIAMRFPE